MNRLMPNNEENIGVINDKFTRLNIEGKQCLLLVA